MWKIAVLLLVAVATCSAYPAPHGQWGYPYNYWGYGFPYNYWGFPYGNHGYNNYGGYYHGGKLAYYGEFPGSCQDKSDGLYYVDDRSFAYCFSGQKSVQPCAEGSANPPVGYFNHGGYYGVYDFCSVNLVAHGYGHPAPAPAYGYHGKDAGPKGESYGKNDGYKTDSYDHGKVPDGYQETTYEQEYKKEAY